MNNFEDMLLQIIIDDWPKHRDILSVRPIITNYSHSSLGVIVNYSYVDAKKETKDDKVIIHTTRVIEQQMK